MKNRKPPVTIAVPNIPKTPYDLSNSGTFTEGDFQISRQGLRISAASDLLDGTAAGKENGNGGSGGAGADGEGGTGGGTGDRGGRGSGGDNAGGSRGNSRDGGRGGAQPSASGAGDKAGGSADKDAIDRSGTGEVCSTSRGSDGGTSSLSGAFDVALEDLQILGVVGKGSSGVVQRALHVPTGNFLAIKIVQMNVQADVRKNIIQELRTLHQSSCSHIVPYHGAFFSDGSISIILDYMDGGSLADVTQALGIIPEPQLCRLAKQVLQGLAYLHKEIHIIHRDVKPSNLLVNKQGEVKISDFGVSGQLANSVTKCNSWVGTVTYMSPERISGKPYSFDSDVWSFGLSLVECAIGRFPYPPAGAVAAETASLGFWDLLDYIVEEAAPELPTGNDYPKFTPEFGSFVARCLQKDPKERSTAPSLLEHGWIADLYKGVDLKLAELICESADKRAAKAKEQADKRAGKTT